VNSQLKVSQAIRLAHIAYWQDEFGSDRINWSAEGSRILGVPDDERSRTWEAFLELVHPDDRAVTAGTRVRAMRGETGYRLAFRVVRSDGDVRHVVIIIDVIRDGAGRPVRAVGAAKDVTDLHEAERAEALYRALIDHTNDMVEVVDPNTGRFLEVNEQACTVHGFTREEYLARRVADFDPFLGDPDTFAENIANLRQVGSLTLEGQHRRKDGSVFPVEVSLTYVHLDRDYLLSVVRDLSERKEAEAALSGSQERLHLALQATGLGPWEWDLGTNDAVYSPEWLRQLGYEPGELPNQYEEWTSRLHPDDREQVLEAQQDYLAGRRPEYAVEFRLRHRDGSYRWIYTRGVALYDADGKPTHMLGYHLDVTKQRKLEEQFQEAQKMQAVGQLAAGVAHDFNNLLVVISGYSDILLELLPPAAAERRMVSAIRTAGERAAGLTRQLLAFSRQSVLEPMVVDLNELVDENEQMLRQLIGEDIQLITTLDPAAGLTKVDPGQFSQILMNLAINARDAMPNGGELIMESSSVAVTDPAAEFIPEARPGSYVALTVGDVGTGMTPEVRTRVFEPFFTTKGAGRGTGLGLATVYGIVQQSDGFIVVESEPGHGTTFKLHFPVADGPASTTHSGDHPVVRGTETILLVEDEDAVRTLICTVLEQAGYTVLEADRGDAALRLVEDHPGPIHLLITDVVMPEMGGRELVERLARLRPEVQVLYVSGHTDDSIVRHGILQAEVAFLQKPFSTAALTHKVRQVLGAEE
jgi:PAS domain S-box-containing protein